MDVCDALDDEGRMYVRQAAEAKDVGVFMGATFLSVPCFQAAWIACQMRADERKSAQKDAKFTKTDGRKKGSLYRFLDG